MTTTPEDPNAPLEDSDLTTSGTDPLAGGGGRRRHRRRRR